MGIERRIVPLYLYEPPATVISIQGIALGITRNDLCKSTEDFTKLEMSSNDPMVKFIDELQDIVNKLIERAGFPKADLPDTVKCVRDMRLAIFSYLKTTVDKILKPQKQIVIRTNVASLQAADGNLPSDAQLIPLGSGSPMNVFGLPNKAMEWGAFISQVSNYKMGDAWRDAINSVVASSLPDEINVDNSRVIVSNDEKNAYRIILTTSTTYYNGRKEFHLYLVEGLRPHDYGDRETTLLLKGLQIVCHFRFMFLESSSKFYSKNILAVTLDKIQRLVRRMVIELDLLVSSAREAGLDQPHIWSQFVKWEDLLQMNKDWIPREQKIREVAANISSYRGNVNDLEDLRKQFAAVIDDMEQATRPGNKLLITQILEKLRQIVDREYERV